MPRRCEYHQPVNFASFHGVERIADNPVMRSSPVRMVSLPREFEHIDARQASIA
jgi:hypothetical protein